jgi:hypothetical protein
MRAVLAVVTLVAISGLALAQSQSQTGNETPASKHSTGRTVSPDTKGQRQPQGDTGPIGTEGRSAPAASPQGQTPPGTHAAPEGSDKTIVEPKE